MLITVILGAASFSYWRWHIAHRLSPSFSKDAVAYFSLCGDDLAGADQFRRRMMSEGSRPSEEDYLRALDIVRLKADAWEKQEDVIQESSRGKKNTFDAVAAEQARAEQKRMVEECGTECAAALDRSAHYRWWGPPKECEF